MKHYSTQLSAALALVQLLQERPELPPVSWEILHDTNPVLHGHVHRGAMDTLRLYAEVLGGAIRPDSDFEMGGRPVRPHYLRTMWRDVPVRLVAVVPLSSMAVAS